MDGDPAEEELSDGEPANDEPVDREPANDALADAEPKEAPARERVRGERRRGIDNDRNACESVATRTIVSLLNRSG